MKKILPFLILTITALSSSGCQYIFMIAAASEFLKMRQELTTTKSEKLLESDVELGKSYHIELDRFPLTEIKLNLDSIETITTQKLSPEEADAAAMMSINQALMSSEKEIILLDVKISMSNEPTEKGFFILAMKSDNAKPIRLEIFDNEGFQMSYTISLNITKGINYFGLNIPTLTEGQYLFRLVDNSSGAELVRSVNIAKE